MVGSQVSVRESAVQFGTGTRMIGLVSEPSGDPAAVTRPAILLLNAGLIHRVGPSRTYVRLARALTRRGFVTMRFDLPGRGDSDLRRGAESVSAQSLVDVQAAMDLLERTKGIKRFIIAGICSGAAGAAEAALGDPRVAGAVLINPLAYPTWQSRIRYYARRIGNARSWWNTLAGRNALGRTLRRALRGQATSDAELLDPQVGAGSVSRQAVVAGLRQLVDRDVQLCVIYSAGPAYNYHAQFEDAFSDIDFKGKLTVEYSAEADHTFTRLINQQWLETVIVRWVCALFADTPQPSAGPGLPTERRTADASGRERLATNVMWGWIGHLVFVAAGFVMPRLIDRELGQARLGVWDFCWSMVHYFNIAQIGIGSSVNRHVAAYRAQGDVRGLNRTVSSVMAVQIVAAIVVLGLTATAWVMVPRLFAGRLGNAEQEAQWVIALLGSSMAVQLAFHVYRGVLTGCHRWDRHNQIDSLFYGVTAVAMMIALVSGGGLISLAAIVLAGHVLTDLARAFVTYRVCPELEIRRRYVSLSEAREMLMFGGKLSIAGIAEIVLIQTNSLLVLSHLGVNALALYARPHALLRHVTTAAKKLSLTLVPTAGSLQSSGRHEELRDLLLDGTRYASLLVIPMLALLAIMGDRILELWMGPGYRQGAIVAVLALGFVLPLTQQPAATILIGMNRHGVLAVTSVAAAAVGVATSAIAIAVLGWGLIGAALSLASAVTVTGVVIAISACRELHVPLGTYLRQAYAKPLAAMVPFAAALWLSRVLWREHPAGQLVAGIVLGGAVLAPLYWFWLLPEGIRARIVVRASGLFRRPSVVPRLQPAPGQPPE